MSSKDIMMIDQYEIYLNNIIGRGQYGTVYQCKNKQNPQDYICAKIIAQNLQDPKTDREIQLMQMIKQQGKNNKNIVGVYHIDINQERIVLILERCECDLNQQFKAKIKNENKYYTPIEVINILKQIVNGYRLLYDNNIIHRDMKPENILYLKGVYKIADFGLARVYKTEDELTKAGTPKYASPQLFIQSAQFTNAADIFSLGLICYELIFACLPYPITSIQGLISSLQKLEYQPIKVDRSIQGMTTEIADLFENMLRYHENQRISWKNLFAHPLMTDIPKLLIQPFKPASQQQGRIILQQSDPTPQKLQTQVNFKSSIELSDQIYQIAFFINQVLDSLDKHMYYFFLSRNQQKSINSDVIKIKQQLYYLTSCFYEHCKAIKTNSFGKFNYSLTDVDNALMKLNQTKVVLNEQINNYGLAQNFPLKEVIAEYNVYFFQLKVLLSSKFLFPYISKSNYYFEYIQLLFCLQKLKELNEQKDFATIYQQIMDIQNQISNEINIRQYLNSKFNI